MVADARMSAHPESLNSALAVYDREDRSHKLIDRSGFLMIANNGADRLRCIVDIPESVVHQPLDGAVEIGRGNF